MEHEDFDRRTRLLAESDGTRRAIIRLVAGGAFGVVAAGLGLAKTEAKKGKGGKGKTKGKKKCKGKGKTTICHNGQTLIVSTCALKTLPGAMIGACTTATAPPPSVPERTAVRSPQPATSKDIQAVSAMWPLAAELPIVARSRWSRTARQRRDVLWARSASI